MANGQINSPGMSKTTNLDLPSARSFNPVPAAVVSFVSFGLFSTEERCPHLVEFAPISFLADKMEQIKIKQK